VKPYRSNKFSARVSPPLRATVALLLLVAFGVGPAAADNDRKHDRGRGQGRDQRHEQNNNRFSDSYRHREWRGQDRNYGYRPIYPQPYLYSQPVYVPPPVYYAPRQSPGISLFFPLDLR
jgi:hypothetical protein